MNPADLAQIVPAALAAGKPFLTAAPLILFAIAALSQLATVRR